MAPGAVGKPAPEIGMAAAAAEIGMAATGAFGERSHWADGCGVGAALPGGAITSLR